MFFKNSNEPDEKLHKQWRHKDQLNYTSLTLQVKAQRQTKIFGKP